MLVKVLVLTGYKSFLEQFRDVSKSNILTVFGIKFVD
jgi:hypothetical protein